MVARNFKAVPGVDSQSDLITFDQAGVGAVERTVQDKLRDIVSVKDFIPAGTDTAATDCSSYIQAAIDAAGVSGGAVYIPSGEYKVLSSLNLTGLAKPIKVYGDGDSSRIIATVASNNPVFNVGSVPQGTTLLSVQIDNIHIRSASSTGHAISCLGSARPILSRLYIYGFGTSGYSGIYLKEVYGAEVSDVICHANSKGLIVEASQANVFKNVQTFASGIVGIHILRSASNPGDNNFFYGTWCENNIGQDIIVETSGNLFSGGWCEGSASSSPVIEVKGNAQDLLVRGNTFENFYMTGGSGALVNSDAANGICFRNSWFARSGTNFLVLDSADEFTNNRFSSVSEPVLGGGSIGGGRPSQIVYNNTILEKGKVNQNVNYKLSSQFGSVYATKYPIEGASKTFYVSSTGSDTSSNPNSAANPALDLQNLIDLAPDVSGDSLRTIIQLQSNMSLNYNLVIPSTKNIFISIGTYTLTFTNNTGITVTGTLGISGSGSIIADASRTLQLIAVGPKGVFNITNSTLTNNSALPYRACIYVDGGYASGSAINLSSQTGLVVTNNGFAQFRNTTGACATNAFVADYGSVIDKLGSTVTGPTSATNGGAIY